MSFFEFDMAASQAWYSTLEKPWFAPPSWIFSPVWTVLYIIIAIVFIHICVRVWRKTLKPDVLIPLFVNLCTNVAFTPLQFGLRSNVLALFDIVMVLGSLIWLIVKLWPRARISSIALVPYLVWVSFATVLQISITLLNAA